MYKAPRALKFTDLSIFPTLFAKLEKLAATYGQQGGPGPSCSFEATRSEPGEISPSSTGV